MRFYSLPSLFVAGLALVNSAHSRAVVAHYMVGNVDESHAHKDIDDALQIGIEAFALNIGDPRPDFVRTSMNRMFDYAASKGFKLFFSLDLWAAGAATPKQDINSYDSLLRDFLGHAAYYKGPNGFPLISTFSDGGMNKTFLEAWKKKYQNQMFLVPNMDGTAGYWQAAAGWWEHWGAAVDGMFSWESTWPCRVNQDPKRQQYPCSVADSTNDGDVTLDKVVLGGTRARGKSYMMGLSMLQYKNAYDTNYLRRGALTLPKRMENILGMLPEYVQIITWNDGPESHYIGNLWPEQNRDVLPAVYARETGWSHKGIQSLVKSFTIAYKAGLPASEMRPVNNQPSTGAMWYKTILESAVCNLGDGLYTTKPDGYYTATDAIHWAVVVPAGQTATVNILSGNTIIQTKAVAAGLNYGSTSNMNSGPQRLEVVSGGTVKAVANGGRCVNNGCPDNTYNMNYQIAEILPGTGSSISCLPGGIFFHAPEDHQIAPKVRNGCASNDATNSWADLFLDDFITWKGGNSTNIDRQLKSYAISGTEQDSNSDCGNLDSDTCWSPECDDLGDEMKDMYWIFREFNNLRTGLKAFRTALEAATLTSSLNISTVIAEIAEPLIKKQIEVRSSSSGVFKALGMGLSIAAPFVGIAGPAGGAASALIGMAGALSTSAGEEPDPVSAELQLLSKLQAALENRQSIIYRQYHNSPGNAAEAIFRTGHVSNFPEWSLGGRFVFANDLPKVFGGDGRYAGQTPTYTVSVGPLTAFMRKDLVNTLLIAANVYVIVNSHPEEDCNFPGAWWGRSGNPPVQQLEMQGPGRGFEESDISVWSTLLPGETITGIWNQGIDPLDIVINSVDCQSQTAEYYNQPNRLRDPHDTSDIVSNYPRCFFNLPVIKAEQWDFDNAPYGMATLQSPCHFYKVRDEYPKADNLSGWNCLPPNLEEKFTPDWCRLD